MEQTVSVEVGAAVVGTDGEVGVVEAIVPDAAADGSDVLVVRRRAGDRVEVPLSLVDAAASSAREVRLRVGADALTAGVTALTAVGDRLVVPVREEVLSPTTRPIELGAVRVHKRVETIPVQTSVDVMRDDVVVERVAVDRPVDAVPAPRHEGDTLIIPVVEEVVVTEKRLVLREEIRVTRRQVTEAVPVSGTVRREVVQIEEVVANAGTAGSGTGAPATPAGVAGTLPPR